MPPAYPPYQQPLVDRATGHVSKPWQLFFLALAQGAANGANIGDGTISFVKLEPIDSPRLLGRGTPGVGPVEQLLIGSGLTLTDLTLSATGGGATGEAGYWAPITNGDALSPELLFDAEGDCVVGFVPTPEA